MKTTGFPTAKRDLRRHGTTDGIKIVTTIGRDATRDATVITGMTGAGEEMFYTPLEMDIRTEIEDLVHPQCLPLRYHLSLSSTHLRMTWQLGTARETTPRRINKLLARLGLVSGEPQADREGTVILMTTARAEAKAVQGEIGTTAVGQMIPMTMAIAGTTGDILEVGVVDIRVGMAMGGIEIVMRSLEGVVMIAINERDDPSTVPDISRLCTKSCKSVQKI
jgi:hypothetical protein